MGNKTDEEIKNLLLSGKKEDIDNGLNYLDQKYGYEVRRFLLSKSEGKYSNEILAEIYQNTLIAVYNNIIRKTYNSDGNLKSYLFAIAKNLLYNQYRKKSYTSSADPSSFNLPDPEGMIGPEDIAPEEIQQLKDMDKIGLTNCLEKLSPLKRELILLRYEENWSVKKTAVHLNKTESWVKVNTKRTKDKLKECIEKKPTDKPEKS